MAIFDFDFSRWRPPPSWFLKFQIFNGRDNQERRTAPACQISSKSVEPWPRYGYFQFFKKAAAAILDLWNFKFLTVGTFKRFEMHHIAKFHQNRSNSGRDMAIFRFFKMSAAAILDFWNFKFLTVETVKRVELHHHAKFRQNHSNRGWDITIFQFFQDGGRPPSWIGNACVGTIHEGHLVVFITVQNLVGIDAVVLIICTWLREFGLKTPIHAPKLGFLKGKIGEGVRRYWPPTSSFLLLGVYTYVSNLVIIDEEMRPWECPQADRHTHARTHRRKTILLSVPCYML